jgi:hypothetical protein
MSAFLRSRPGVALLGFLAIVAYYLATTHTAHVLSALPYAVLALCPLLHLFMHGRHGGHGSHGAHGDHTTSEAQAADRRSAPFGQQVPARFEQRPGGEQPAPSGRHDLPD